MFVESDFSWSIPVKPHQWIGVRQIQRALVRNLLRRFDSTQCTEEHGYFVAVTSIERIGEGTIEAGTGIALYPVCFRGLTLKPLQGETVFATVDGVGKDGISAKFGPGSLTILGEKTGGYKFQKEGNRYEHRNGSVITPGSYIRVQILQIKWEDRMRGLLSSGSLEGEFLGVIQQHVTRPAGEATGHKGKRHL